jgi:CDP-glycerol glycerophosphotransferase
VGGFVPSRRLVVLEADGGRSFDGNVRALSDGLATARLDVVQAWVHRSNPAGVPPGVEGVERQSLRSVWLLARAAVVVNDGTAAPLTAPGARSRVVNAGTGVPFHRLGLDDPSVLVSRAGVAAVRRRARRWDLVLAPSAESARILQGAFGYGGASIDVGLPRLDGPAAERHADLAALRRRLDLPDDRAIIIWTPAQRTAGTSTELLDLDAWATALGTRAYLVVRGLAGELGAVPTRLRSFVRDLAREEDVLPFLAAADLLVSDYSPFIGDAVALDVPVVLFQPDREEYVNRTRGLYPWSGDAGPVVESEPSLVAEVARWLDDPEGWDAAHGSRRREWAARAAGPVDGTSTRRAVDALLAQLERR